MQKEIEMALDKCVLCNNKTKFSGLQYVDGSGQLCQVCYKKIYSRPKEKKYKKPIPS